MKRNLKYLVLPGVQALGAVLLFSCNYKLPTEMSKYMALAVVILGVLGGIVFRLLWILLSSYVINLSKFFFYKMKKENIVSVCLFPVFVYKEKRRAANIFWIYDDRTCFSMNRYVKDKEGFERLRQFILQRNRILAGVYIYCSFMSVLICIFNQWFVLSWIFCIGAIEHFLYQCEYKTIGTANAMAFAGLRSIDDRLLLHVLVNQSKMENLDIGEEVAEILSADMYDRDRGYFFQYLCLSGMFYEISKENPNGYEFMLRKYMDQKIDDILEGNDKVMNSVKYTEGDPLYKNIDKEICLFYDNYREFLLYVLMYYDLKREDRRYKHLYNYITYMLEEVEVKCVHDSILSEKVLSNKFDSYKALFQQVLEKSFVPETSVFTGYETLPIWNKQRKVFVEKFNMMDF